jgi:hypothetical protein
VRSRRASFSTATAAHNSYLESGVTVPQTAARPVFVASKEEMIDRTQRHAAVIFAITFPLSIVLMTVAFSRYLAPILVWNQDAETARNRFAHAHSYRMFISASRMNGLAGVVLLTTLYVVLRPVNRGLALFAAFCRLVYVAMWFVQLLASFSALRIMEAVGPLQAFKSEQLQALAGLQLASGWDAYLYFAKM